MNDETHNTLHRLSKRSPRLVLERYSHNDVPVGCGGFVMQWRDPTDGHLFDLWLASMGEGDVSIDGQPMKRLLKLRPGPHQLRIHLTALPDRPTPFGFEIRTRGEDRETVLSTARGGFFLEGGAPLEPFAGDPLQDAGHRRWWFEDFERSALFSVPPREAVILGTIETIDAKTLR